MDPTQNVAASEKSAVPSCQPLVETLVNLGRSWAVHGLKMGRNAVQMSAETLGKTVQSLDALAAVLEQKAAKGESPEAASPAAAAEPGA
jgi:hypothetical protein